MSVHLSDALVREIRAHGRSAYPDECCGFLIGPTEGVASERTISAVERAGNEFKGERRRRFLILPEELREVERRLEGSGRSVLGFYHSHPDHPARPSQYDQDHAWPWYSYLVLAVTADDEPALGAFELDPDSGIFQTVPLSVTGDRAAVPSVAKG